jgi:hypothetical protein
MCVILQFNAQRKKRKREKTMQQENPGLKTIIHINMKLNKNRIKLIFYKICLKLRDNKIPQIF